MNSKLFFIALLILGSFSVSAQTYSESQLQDLFMDMLEDQGMEGWIDSDGDVQFDYEDLTFFIEVNEDDNEFFRVVLPNIWPIESTTEATTAVYAVNTVNSTKKTAKAYIHDDNVWIAVELFIDNPKNVKPVFMRSLGVIMESVDLFVEEM